MSVVIPIIVAVLDCLCGFAAFIVFVIFQNYASAVLGFLTGVASSVLLFLHILVHRRQLQDWYNPSDLFQICRLGFTFFAVGFLCLVYNSVIEILLYKPILPIRTSNVITIVWSLILLKSGLFLVYYTLKYEKLEDAPLIGNGDVSVEQGQEDDKESHRSD